jgi:hypothetical protein
MVQRLLLFSTAIAALAPAAAGARVIGYGSTLDATPNIVETHGADTAFWPVAAPHGRRVRAPATGQILTIRLKGTVLRRQGQDPLNEVHFQHLRPLGDGQMRVLQTSGAFRVPIGGPRDTISTFRPVNLCVRRGDVIDLNDEGGFAPPAFPNGAPFRVFARVRGARTARSTQGGQTNNGDVLVPDVRAGNELLMRLALGTGRQAGGACRNFNASS